jgi:hypothetical protein
VVEDLVVIINGVEGSINDAYAYLFYKAQLSPWSLFLNAYFNSMKGIKDVSLTAPAPK